MTSRELFHRKICKECNNFETSTGIARCKISVELYCYFKYLEERNTLMLEALKAIDESINDNCISDAQMMIKNIINQVQGE
jgi:hypothetical protein